jgi:hypothetical protein
MFLRNNMKTGLILLSALILNLINFNWKIATIRASLHFRDPDLRWMSDLVQNQDFDWRKISSFDETLQTDQIEGAEFEFLGPKTRFERNKRSKFLNVKMKILEPKSKIRQGHASSRDQKSHFPDS